MFLRTDRDCEVGARFNISFSLPGLVDVFETLAEVVWRRRPPLDAGLGVRFLDLTESQRTQIATFVLDRWSLEARSVLLALRPHPLRNELREKMSAAGLHVLCADDGEGALAHLRSLGGLGAVVLDTGLPGNLQLEVLLALRSQDSVLAREVPILLLLRKALSPPEIDRLRTQGASAVLTWGEQGNPARVVAAALRLMGRGTQKQGSLPAE
jgi:CheY-like chemotaxis protein